ncbi:MAG: hypothetical protein H7Z13_05925 [Ferruginibacter sp.]|nr:hypothetical protein [Ferruginibacter sp.]
MMKKQFFVAAVISVLVVSHASAQKSRSFNSSSYTTALGVKVYPGSGGAAVTIKHFVNKAIALEALGYAWERGGRATGLLEFHWDIPAAPGLKWYVGPGVHVGFYNDKYYNDIRDGKGSYVSAGLDGVIGLDYKFKNIPLNLSADWQPSYDFGNERYHGFGGDFGGIAARYTF